MKKILAVILTVAALCLCMVSTVSAAGDMELIMNVTSGEYVVGSNAAVTLEVSIKNNPGLSGIQLFINYPEWLVPDTTYTPGSIWPAAVIATPMNPSNNQLSVYIYGSTGTVCATNDGVVATFSFKVDESKLNSSNVNKCFEFDKDNTYGAGDLGAGDTEDKMPKSTNPEPIDVKCTAHKYSGWKTNTDEHWHVCDICGEEADRAGHDRVITCVSSGTCTVCEYTDGGEGDGKSHKWGTELVVDTPATCYENGEGHYECEYKCGEKSEPEIISKDTVPHTVDEKAFVYDGDSHWNVCSVAKCGAKVNVKSHTKVVKSDDDNHWTECKDNCGWKSAPEKHDFEEHVDANGHYDMCKVKDCSKKLNEKKHTDIAEFVPAKKATSSEDGNLAYWYCPECGKYYLDKDGVPVGEGKDTPDDFIIKYNAGCGARGHHFVVVPATDDYHMMICINKCGTVMAMPHSFNFAGVCSECGHKLDVDNAVDGGFIDVDAPTQSTDNVDDEDDNITVTDPEPTKDENPKTGIALSAIPALIAAAVVATKKH